MYSVSKTKSEPKVCLSFHSAAALSYQQPTDNDVYPWTFTLVIYDNDKSLHM